MQGKNTKKMKNVMQNNSKDYNEKKKNKNIEETEYLSRIPGYVNEINHIRKTEVWKENEEYNPEEEW